MLQNSEGKRVPQVTFRTRAEGQWKDVTTEELFKGRTVIVFALPGAYTPTCRATTSWRAYSARRAWTTSCACR
jgi:glutathione-dependent peroxiredoxin